MRRRKMLALLLSLVMVVSLLHMAALAEEPGGSQPGTYVLMNIPYAQFYAAEKGETGTVDAVSGATLKYAKAVSPAGPTMMQMPWTQVLRSKPLA